MSWGDDWSLGLTPAELDAFLRWWLADLGLEPDHIALLLDERTHAALTERTFGKGVAADE